MKSIDEVASESARAQIFSVLDAGNAFWQIPLDEESSKLVTFNSPYGRYMFNRLPFEISSAPEVFQKRISQIFEGMGGSKCIWMIYWYGGIQLSSIIGCIRLSKEQRRKT